jgi:hypothetical protein
VLRKKLKNPLIIFLMIWGFFSLLSDNLCVFKLTIGFPCPGCGMTRAYLALFRGEIGTAFFYHPLFWLIPIAAVVLLFHKKAGIKKIFKFKGFWIGLFAIFMTVYVVRMVLLFPHTPPMDYHWNSIWGWIIRGVQAVIR